MSDSRVAIHSLLGLAVEPCSKWHSPGLFLAMVRSCHWRLSYCALQPGQAALLVPISKLSAAPVAVFGVALVSETPSAANRAGVASIAAEAVLVAWR